MPKRNKKSQDKKEQLKALALQLYDKEHLSSSAIAAQIGTTKDSVQKWIRRRLPQVTIPDEMILRGPALVIGDVHSYAADWDYLAYAFDAAKDRNIDTLILAGDLVCFDKFSRHPEFFPHPAFDIEEEHARYFFDLATDSFKHIKWVTGNHDERMGLLLNGSINIGHLARLFCPDGQQHKIETTLYNTAKWFVGGREWLVSHSYKYGKRLSVAQKLSALNECSVIQAHQHLAGISPSDNGRHILIDNGCMCIQGKTPYATLRQFAMPVFNRAFTILTNEEIVFDMGGNTNVRHVR